MTRESLTSIFGRVTGEMSRIQRPRELPTGIEMLCQLPEMVSSLSKEIFFFEPEKTVTLNQYQVSLFFNLKNFLSPNRLNQQAKECKNISKKHFKKFKWFDI